MEHEIIITSINGGYAANTVIHTASKRMTDSDVFPPDSPFWTRNDDKPRPWRFENCGFVDANGVELKLTYEEVDRELERLHNYEVNQKYKLTLGYKIRRFLGLRIPEFHNRVGWY
jgi:hypothetical protein